MVNIPDGFKSFQKFKIVIKLKLGISYWETLMMGTRLFFLFCVLLWYVLQLMKPYVRFTSTYYMDEPESRIKCDSAKMKIETCRQKLEEVKKALELAEKESNDAQIELNEKKKWRRTVQKRTLYLATIAMKEDDSDLGINNLASILLAEYSQILFHRKRARSKW